MKPFLSCTILSILLLGCFSLPAQTLHYLSNPSFEGNEPQEATVPAGWEPCKDGTTPDILPGPWNVALEASEGQTFVGLITREDGSWESIGQRIENPLKEGECYALTLDLAHSPTYAGYNQPLRLRVWGGLTKCGRGQLLATSKVIDQGEWQTFTFKFIPKQTTHYILIEAFYPEGVYSRYKGNILIDNIQPIKQCVRA